MDHAEKLHLEAMKYVSQAIMLKDNKPNEYQKLMHAAFELEEKAAYTLYGRTDIEPARSILFQSAANIASEIELYDEACKMIYAALSGDPPFHIASNLNDLYETIQFSKHLQLENIEMSKNTINVSIYGSLVGSGIVLYEVFKQKVDAVSKMLIRSVQRIKYPDNFNTNKHYDLRKQYPIFVQAMGKGCLSVGLKLGLDESNESNLLDRHTIETSIEEFTQNVDLLNKEDYETLKARINNDDYYRSITEIYREILPDGKNISGVNITAQLEKETIELCITKTKPAISTEAYTEHDPDIVRDAEKGSELVLEGLLRMADNTKKEPYVKLVLPDTKEYKIYLDESTIDDVVSSYWDDHVVLKVLKKGKEKLVYLDIERA
jgi:hypothetical protein